MSLQLTDEQNNVISSVKSNIFHEQVITIGGYAGSGKLTILSYLTEHFPDFAVCCYTGKAANVLRRKGVTDANTIHSTIYHCDEDYKGRPRFRLKPRNKLGYNGFFIDEASMVSEEIFKDLLSYNMPLIFVGDHGQLEPIGSSFNLMKKPEFVLETIHRNANTIAKFAHHIRQGNPAESFEGFDDLVSIGKKYNLTAAEGANYDQIICGYNKTRRDWNNRIRRVKGFKDTLSIKDKIICLKNNKELGVFNGMQGTVKKLYKNGTILFDNGEENLKLDINYDQFFADKLLNDAHDNRDVAYFDYGYCITCHKAQGDEWGSVCVLEEKAFIADGWDQKRWSYTAASRAKTKLLWCV